MVLLAVVHLIIKHRWLLDADCYHDDGIIKRTRGLKCLPDALPISRSLGSADRIGVEKASR